MTDKKADDKKVVAKDQEKAVEEKKPEDKFFGKYHINFLILISDSNRTQKESCIT